MTAANCYIVGMDSRVNSYSAQYIVRPFLYNGIWYGEAYDVDNKQSAANKTFDLTVWYVTP